MPIASIVADANVLLSAVCGRAALRVFTEFDVTVHVAEFNVDEVFEYLPLMAAKYDLPNELLEMQWQLLPLRRHPVDHYRSRLERAVENLAKRDPEDAHALALARHLDLPLWSNDRDFESCGVPCYPTARLLSVLKKQKEGEGG